MAAGGNVMLLNGVDSTGSATSMTIANGGQLYAQNNVGAWFVFNGAWVNIPAIPIPPQPGCVTLGWDASPSATATGYTIYYGTASGSYTGTVNALSALSYRVDNLKPDTMYYFVVKAHNDFGNESPPSNEVNSIPAVAASSPTPTPSPSLLPPVLRVLDPSPSPHP